MERLIFTLMSYSIKISVLQEEILYGRISPITLGKPATTYQFGLYQCVLGVQKPD